jgi:hypothetical protein
MIHPAGIAYAATANKELPGARSAHGLVCRKLRCSTELDVPLEIGAAKYREFA